MLPRDIFAFLRFISLGVKPKVVGKVFILSHTLNHSIINWLLVKVVALQEQLFKLKLWLSYKNQHVAFILLYCATSQKSTDLSLYAFFSSLSSLKQLC